MPYTLRRFPAGPGPLSLVPSNVRNRTERELEATSEAYLWAFMPGDTATTLDFQVSRTRYETRTSGRTLKRIGDVATAIDDNAPVGPGLLNAARKTLTAAEAHSKAYVTLDGRRWLAKFQPSYDGGSPLIKAERAALDIAEKARLDVPASKLGEAALLPPAQD